MPDPRWKPNVTVAAVVERDGRYLLVEEHSVDGSLKLNNPAGHLDPDESLVEAVVREVLEETACRFKPTHLIGVYMARALGVGAEPITYLRFAFTGTVSEPEPGRALDEGIVRTLWLTPQQIESDRPRHRSPLLMRCVEDHHRGQRFALGLLHTDPSVFVAAAGPSARDKP
jgi:8-oxo-dGTP pyrophosphatase MutT (NUDIX family)